MLCDGAVSKSLNAPYMGKRDCFCVKNGGEAAIFHTETKENFSSFALYKLDAQL
jgi:hypothetical protein